jgi:tetratricopeptide (TPR) repeat protein
MPKRRTEDVVHVVMTDHRIARGPFGPELLAPRREQDPILVEARFFRPAEAPAGAEGEVYRAVGVARIGARTDSVPYLERRLAAGAADPSSPAGEVAAAQEPWLRLGEGQLLLGRYAAAEVALDRAIERGPAGALVRIWQGLAAAGQGRRDEAIARMREAAVVDPELAEAHFNLGRLLLAWGDPTAAIPPLERALALRPNLPAAWLRRGEAREALGRRAEAIADYRRAIAVDPGLTGAHLALVGALRAAGDEPAAREALELGTIYARQPEALAGAAGGAPTPEP